MSFKKCAAAVLSVALAFSAFAAGQTEAGKGQAAGAAASSNVTSPGTFPVVTQKVSYRVFAGGDPGNVIPDPKENWFSKYWEEKTNVRIDWEYTAAAQPEMVQKINLRMASGDLPDFFLVNGSYRGFDRSMQVTYGSQGLIIPVNDLVEKYSVNVKKALQEYPAFKQAWTAPDGKMYGLGSISECYHCSLSNKMWVYQPWLDKLGMKMPETVEDFAAVLRAFRDKDPNGNGKQDEVPMINLLNQFLMSSFIYHDGTNLMVSSGKVLFTADKNEFRAGLKYLAGLYKEGLVAKDVYTMDAKQLNAVMLSEVQSVGVYSGLAPLMYPRTEGSRLFEFTTVPPLKGPTGLRQTPYIKQVSEAGVLNITKAAKNPEIIIRWIDGLYQLDNFASAHYGPERTGPEENKPGWYKAKPGQLGADGKQAFWTRIMYPATDARFIPNIAFGLRVFPSYQPAPYHTGMIIDMKANYASRLDIELYGQSAKNYEAFKKDDSLPPMFISDAANAEIAELRAVIDRAVTEATAQFVTGARNIDTDWDAYIGNLKKLGLEKYVSLYQKEFDLNNRK
jgi:putative aldouronate transport system substrate-binding protein